jgi:HTH-type transcriptional regulator/antitoxin HigA
MSKGLRSDKELDEATREACALMSSKAALSDADERRLQQLVGAIEAYEDVHYPIPEPSHAALLKHLLVAKPGLKKLAMATRISVSELNDILRGKRQVSPKKAQALSGYFSVEPSVFEPEADTVVMVGVHIHSGSVGVRAMGEFRFTSGSSGTSTASKNGLPASVASLMRHVLQTAGSVPPPLVGLKS